MKPNLFITLIICCLPCLTNAQTAERDTFRLYFLGGQSNMDGYGYSSDLPESLDSSVEDVWIYHGNPAADENKSGGNGKWEILKPGHGKGFTFDGNKNNLTNRFGPELSFARKLKELYPDEKIAIIKYSKSGSSIDSLAARHFGSWDPDYRGTTGINQYDHCLRTIGNAFDTYDIDTNGVNDQLIPSGIVWMQGESDAKNEQVARRYYGNLKRLMGLIRASLRVDDLPIAIGKISDSGDNEEGKVWKYGELVQHAQETLALTDLKVDIVRSTQHYGYSDRHHYDSAGYIDLGEKFAEAIYQLSLK